MYRCCIAASQLTTFVCYFSPQKPALCNSNESFLHTDQNLASYCLRFSVCSARFLSIANCTWRHQSLWNTKPLTHSYAWEALKTLEDRCWFTTSLSTPPLNFVDFALPPLSHYINVCQNKHTGISCNEECNKLPKKTKKLRSLFELHFRTCGKLAEMLSQASNGWPCILYTKSFVYQNVPFDVH